MSTALDPPLAVLDGVDFAWEIEAPTGAPDDGRPTGCSRWCVIAPSGHASDLDRPGPEQSLTRALVRALHQLDVGTIRYAVPARADLQRPATDSEIDARTQRLATVLHEHRATHPGATHTLLGLSLGALSVLEVLATTGPAAPLTVEAAVLVGCVIDRPVTVHPRVRSLELVYGADDLLGTFDEHGTIREIAPPATYGPLVAAAISGGPALRVTVRVLPDLDHLLQPRHDHHDHLGGPPAHELAHAIVDHFDIGRNR